MIECSNIPTLADILARIDTMEEGTRRRDLKSAVSSFCKAVGKPPEEILVIPHEIRALREAVQPLAIGISKARWANICSGLTKAIALVRNLVPSRNTTPLLPEWEPLLDVLPKHLVRKMSPGARYFSGKGVEPSVVSLDDLLGYCQAIKRDRMRRNAEQAADDFLWAWNRTAQQYPAWPQVLIPREHKRDTYSLPMEAFPPSFAADVDAYIGRLTQGILFDLDEEDDEDDIDFGPLRPVRPATVATRRQQLRAAASALVHSGVKPEDIMSIATLVELPNAKRILNFMMQRNPDGQSSAGVAQLATLIAKVAQHWVKVDPIHHAKLKRLAARVAVPVSGMTAKNRARLRVFDDPEMVAAFVCLPDTIKKAVEKDRRAPKLKAHLAQMAAAIAIQIVIPLRGKNLATIDISRHLVSNRNGVYLVIPEAETKNREPINFQIPGFALEIVKWYIRDYRPYYLVTGASSALFPRRGGAFKATQTLGLQLKKTIKQFLGIDFNTHLFRHAAGKIFLDINPGNYEVLRQLLRHKSINTTTSAYSGAETRKAGLLYADLVESLRAAHAPRRTAKGRRS